MKNVRVYWDAETGWVVDTPIALSKSQLEAVIAWTKKVQVGRLADRPTEVREQMAQALRSLKPETLKQNLLPESGYKDGERVLWKK